MNLLAICLFVLQASTVVQDPAPTAEELREHVRWLADDAREGRRAGSPTSQQAAEYLATAFAAAGLKPAGSNGSWFQEFEIALPARAGDSSLCVHSRSKRAGSTLTWKGLGTLALSANSSVSAALTSAGYGMVLASHGVDEIAEAGVSGKVVLLRRYSEFGPNPDPPFDQLGNLRAKIRHAAEAGAVGVIVGTHPDDLARGGEAAIPFAAARGTLAVPVVTVAPEQLRQLEDELAAGAAISVDLSAEIVRGKATARNVLALLPGSSEELLVVGAHFDHLGFGGEGSLAPGEHAVHNGADDNASGTAVVLELAEMLAARTQRPRRGVLFALWDAEELGLLGSQHWVREPTVAREQILANVNLDMVGRLQDGHVVVGSHETASAFQTALDALGEPAADLELRLTGGSLPGGGGSDHMAFHREGLAAMFLFSGLHSDYHKPSDDWQKLDYARMATLSRELARLIDELAGLPSEDFAYRAPETEEKETRVVAGAQAWFGSIPDYGATPEDGGMQLAGVSPGGPAEKAGLKKGDVLKKVGEVAVRDIYDFMDAMAKYAPGDTVQVELRRAGEKLVVPVRLSSRSSGQ